MIRFLLYCPRGALTLPPLRAPFPLPVGEVQGWTGVYQTPVLPPPKAEQVKRCTFSADKGIWQSEAAARIVQSYR